MRSFRESLLLKVSGLAEQLEERVFHLYDLHNKLIQERLQELEEVMERVGQAKTELQQVCLTVEAAYRDLCLQMAKAPGQFTGQEAPRQSPAQPRCRVPLGTPSPIGDSRSVWRYLVLSVTASPVGDSRSCWGSGSV
uniref:Synaptonemal complex central element protein 2 n=1 Tax=Otus sunia TaxID=257818 RepID=A0A8C8B3G3_9STRI